MWKRIFLHHEMGTDHGSVEHVIGTFKLNTRGVLKCIDQTLRTDW